MPLIRWESHRRTPCADGPVTSLRLPLQGRSRPKLRRLLLSPRLGRRSREIIIQQFQTTPEHDSVSRRPGSKDHGVKMFPVDSSQGSAPLSSSDRDVHSKLIHAGLDASVAVTPSERDLGQLPEIQSSSMQHANTPLPCMHCEAVLGGTTINLQQPMTSSHVAGSSVGKQIGRAIGDAFRGFSSHVGSYVWGAFAVHGRGHSGDAHLHAADSASMVHEQEPDQHGAAGCRGRDSQNTTTSYAADESSHAWFRNAALQQTSTSDTSCSTQLSPDARKQLTLTIINCTSIHQVHTLVELHSEQLDHIHLAAAMVKAAKMASGSKQLDSGLCSLVGSLCQRVPDYIHLLDHRQTSNMLWSLAIIIPIMQRQSPQRSRYLNSRASKLRVSHAGGSPTATPTAAGERSNPAAAATAGECSDPATAAATAGAALQQAQRLSLKMQQFWDEASPQSLANTIWAMARLRLRPKNFWFRGFLASSQPLLPAMRPRELTSTLWALATLSLWPGSSWGAACMAAWEGSMPRFGAQAHANMLWAAVKLQLPMPAGLLQKVSVACLDKLSSAAGSCLEDTASSCGIDTTQPSLAGKQSSCDADVRSSSGSTRDRFLPQHLVAILVSLFSLHRDQGLHRHGQQRPPSTQRLRTASSSASFQDSCSPDLHSGRWCEVPRNTTAYQRYGPTRAAPEWRLVAAIVEAADAMLETMPAQGLANMAYSLARLEYEPTAAWTRRFLWAAAARAGRFSAAGLCQLMWALARWGARPDQQWFHTITQAAVTAGLPAGMTVTQLSTVLVACASMKGQPASGFVHIAVATSHKQLLSCSIVTAAQLCLALGELQVWPGRAWMRSLYDLAQRRQEELSPGMVAKLLGGVAAMPAYATGNNASSSSGRSGAASLTPLTPPAATKEEQSAGSLDSSSSSSSSSGAGAASNRDDGSEAIHGIIRSLQFPHGVLHSLLSHALQHARNGDICHIAEAAWAAVRLGHMFGPSLIKGLLLLVAGPAVNLLSGRAALQLLATFAVLDVWPPGTVLVQVSERMVRMASGLDSDDMQLLTHLLAARIPPEGYRAWKQQNAVVTSSGSDGSAETVPPPPPHLSERVPAVVSAAVLAGLSRFPARQLADLICCVARTRAKLGSEWGAAVEAATLAKLSLTGFGGMLAAERVCLLGALLSSDHRPSQQWLNSWASAVVAGAQHLAPEQMLAAARLPAAAVASAASAAALQQAAGQEQQQQLLHMPVGFLAALDSAAVASAYQMQYEFRMRLASSSSSTQAHSTALPTWGPGRLAALSAHLHMAGLTPSSALQAASDAALAMHLQRPTTRSKKKSYPGPSTAQILVSLMELAPLASRRCGPTAIQAVMLLLDHVTSQAPSHVLDSIQEATSPAAAPIQHSSSSRNGGSAAQQDPLEPFYAALAIRGPHDSCAAVFASAPLMLCSLFDMLASWGCQPSQAWLSGLVQAACSRARPDVDGHVTSHLGGRHLFSLLKAIALIRTPVSAQSVQSLLGLLSEQRLQECSPKQLAEVAWALGALQYRPESGWWEQYEAVLLSPLAEDASVGSMAAARQLPNQVAHGSSSGVPAVRAMPAQQVVLLVDSMAGKQLCEVVWACATLRLIPSTTLLSGLASAAAKQLPTLDPASLSNLLWSLFILDEGGPGPAWMDLWLSESAGKMAGFGAQELALAASGLVAARYKPRQEWLAKFLAQAQANAAQCRGPQLERIVCGLAELDCHPDLDWITAFADCARHPSMAAELSETSYARLAWAFDRLSRGGMPAGTWAGFVASTPPSPALPKAAPRARAVRSGGRLTGSTRLKVRRGRSEGQKTMG